MALSDIVTRTRTILYGSGLGEKPAVRRAASDASESISGSIVTFDLLSGEGANVAEGDVLSVYDPADETAAHVLYVVAMSTDQVTAINGYLGSPAVAADDLDDALLEQIPLVTGYEIFEAIDTVMEHYLYPEVYNIETATIASPDLTDGQEEVPADVEYIMKAYQIIGPSVESVAVQRHPEIVHTGLSATGKLANFDWRDGSTGYYTYVSKYVEADEASTELTQLIALGAAAVSLGGHLVETTIQGTKAHNAEAVTRRQQVGSILWRDFLTLKAQHSMDLTKQGANNQIVVNRG